MTLGKSQMFAKNLRDKMMLCLFDFSFQQNLFIFSFLLVIIDTINTALLSNQQNKQKPSGSL